MDSSTSAMIENIGLIWPQGYTFDHNSLYPTWEAMYEPMDSGKVTAASMKATTPEYTAFLQRGK